MHGNTCFLSVYKTLWQLCSYFFIACDVMWIYEPVIKTSTISQYVWLFKNIFRLTVLVVYICTECILNVPKVWTVQSVHDKHWNKVSPVIVLTLQMYSVLSFSYLFDFFIYQWPLSCSFVSFCSLVFFIERVCKIYWYGIYCCTLT